MKTLNITLHKESIETVIYLYEVVGIKTGWSRKIYSFPELALKHFNEHWLNL